MTRKHFKEVAELLNKFRDYVSADTFSELVNGFSDLFVLDNPKFDSEKFIKAVYK